MQTESANFAVTPFAPGRLAPPSKKSESVAWPVKGSSQDEVQPSNQ